MSLKSRISSPLEAGVSILDAHHLPPHLLPALEHASARLARKSIHVTLVVVRRDYQLPPVAPPHGAPGLPSPSPSPSPATPASPPRPGRLTLAASSSVSALKQLVRAGSTRSLASARSLDLSRCRAPEVSPTYPAYTQEAAEAPSARMRWPLSPATPLSPPPMTPCTTASSLTTDTAGMGFAGAFGMRLVHAGGLRPGVEKTLALSLSKAAHKFGIGSDWLAPAASPVTYGLTEHLVHSSIAQNEALFSSEGLTLVSLDGLYSLKSALSSYSKTRSPMRLEDAVDELRRLVLANNGSKVTRSDLLRSFDWLSVSSAAISDLDRMYRRAYGGPGQVGAISGMSTFAERVMEEPSMRDHESFFEEDEVGAMSDMPTLAERMMPEPVIRDDDSFFEGDEQEGDYETAPISLSATPIGKTPSPKPPLLKLQTSFDSQPRPMPREVDNDEEDEEDGDRTARPTDQLPIAFQPWNSSSIDQVLSAVDVLSPARSSMRLGPMTPNGHDDISPITRGEWGFLMVDNAFQAGRTVRVETF